MTEPTDRDLLYKLGVKIEPKLNSSRTPREERIISGFKEIQDFYSRNNRFPDDKNSRDIFERLYAVRLSRLRHLKESQSLIEELDHQGLLNSSDIQSEVQKLKDLDDAALLAELKTDTEAEAEAQGLTTLLHVRSS